MPSTRCRSVAWQIDRCECPDGNPHTSGKREVFEIAALVTSEAIDALVFSDEGIPGFGVIEFLVYVLQRNPLPARSAVTGLAGLRNSSLMRIGVAVGAFAEHKAHVTRLVIGTRCVTFLASDLGVQSG